MKILARFSTILWRSQNDPDVPYFTSKKTIKISWNNFFFFRHHSSHMYYFFLNIYLIILHLLLAFLAWFSSYRYGKLFLLYRTRKKRRWALLNFAISRVIIAVLNVSLSDNLRKEIWVLYRRKKYLGLFIQLCMKLNLILHY